MNRCYNCGKIYTILLKDMHENCFIKTDRGWVRNRK
jgi:hypothetical protein